MAAARRPDGPTSGASDGRADPPRGRADSSGERLAEVARELYGLSPEEFTAARTAAVKQARAAGDRELATQVGALRRPAVAAWAVNLMVRSRAALIEQVTSMGDSLREAQAQLDGAALRDLIKQRRQLVAAVTAEVEAVAASQDHPLSAAASRQVEETVQAALVDPRAAAAVRSGLLVQPLTSTGVDSFAEVLGVPLPPQPAAAPATSPTSDRPSLSLVTEDEESLRRAARERAAAAEKAARKAAKARDKALASRAKAQARVLQLEATLEELRGRLAETEVQAEEATRRLADRESAAEEAEAEAEEAEAAAQEAARGAARVDGSSRSS